MVGLTIIPKIEDGQLADKLGPTRPKHGLLEVVGGLPAGMGSGATSVTLVIKLDDGTKVVAETSLKLFAAASAAMVAAAPEYQEAAAGSGSEGQKN